MALFTYDVVKIKMYLESIVDNYKMTEYKFDSFISNSFNGFGG